MAVYTEVSFKTADYFLQSLGMQALISMTPCLGGIENTNYFVETGDGHFVLTLFERLKFSELHFYLGLMEHLEKKGIPAPKPVANVARDLVSLLEGKPASVVNKLRGASQLAPDESDCAQMGEMLARMHLAGLGFLPQQANLRGLDWMNATEHEVASHIPSHLADLLRQELTFQNQLEATSSFLNLPKGIIHADFFRDNVLFEKEADGMKKISGVFDFYFAGYDYLAFDVAICLNDWCIDFDSCALLVGKTAAFLAGYQKVRVFTFYEKSFMSSMLRRAALRFWLSRLWDFYLPRKAKYLKAHDPSHFERILLLRIKNSVELFDY